MATTINDVAKKAGVTIGTVSKVLNNYNNISEKTKQKVLQAAQELNYFPNKIASALASKNSNRVALYLYINDQRQAIDEINMQYLLGAFKAAQEENLDITTIFNHTLEKKDGNQLIYQLKSEGIESLLIYGLNKKDKMIHEIIKSEIFNCVVVDAPIFNHKTTSISVDHFSGQYDVAKKLILEYNKKNVLYLAGKVNGYVTDQRYAGMQKLAQELKLDLKTVFCDFSEKKAYQATLKYHQNYDVIVCASDLMAIGAKHALESLKIEKPISGYDGISLLGYVGQDILTCYQNFYVISFEALKELKKLMQGAKGKQVLIDYQVLKVNYDSVVF